MAKIPDQIQRIRIMELKPDDTIVASLKAGEYDPDDLDAIKMDLEREFPHQHVVVVVGLELFVGRER